MKKTSHDLSKPLFVQLVSRDYPGYCGYNLLSKKKDKRINKWFLLKRWCTDFASMLWERRRIFFNHLILFLSISTKPVLLTVVFRFNKGQSGNMNFTSK